MLQSPTTTSSHSTYQLKKSGFGSGHWICCNLSFGLLVSQRPSLLPVNHISSFLLPRATLIQLSCLRLNIIFFLSSYLLVRLFSYSWILYYSKEIASVLVTVTFKTFYYEYLIVTLFEFCLSLWSITHFSLWN